MTGPALGALDPADVVVLLPIGSIEQHSYHLPTGTDTMLAMAVAAEVERRRANAVVLSAPVWYGASSHHLGFPGTASVATEALVSQVVGVVRSLAHSSKFARFFILNGHGGNEPGMRVALEHLRSVAPDCVAYAASYWSPMLDAMAKAGEAWPQGMGHACDLETSLMLAVHGPLVDSDRIEPDARTGSVEPWLHETRGFRQMTAHGGMGDPTGASAERGRWLLGLAVEGVVRLVDRLRSLPP